jgi:hypothetical protein
MLTDECLSEKVPAMLIAFSPQTSVPMTLVIGVCASERVGMEVRK